MKRVVLNFSFIILLLALSSCFRPKVEGNYHVEKLNRDISDFTEIVSESDLDVYYYPDSICNVSIEAEGNLIPFIETSNHGNTLVIKKSRYRRFENHYPIKVFVGSPSLTSIILGGSGFLKTDLFNATNLTVVLNGSGEMYVNSNVVNLKAIVSGSGNLNLTGQNSSGDLSVSGSGEINAFNMFQDSCIASVSGSGSMNINVSEFLNAKVNGSGKIKYIGNPYLISNVSGSGKIVRL